ncbi:hypothetical protein ACF08O_01175 [Streptomyces paradoxus]|uniref:hypothetical protein n=1 Tax=Streptomyces paradoxus TaxID=66375 RepID=UPI0037001AC1
MTSGQPRAEGREALPGADGEVEVGAAGLRRPVGVLLRRGSSRPSRWRCALAATTYRRPACTQPRPTPLSS